MFVTVIALKYAFLVSQWSYGHFLKLTDSIYLNNTINLPHLTQRVISCYTHKMAIVLYPWRHFTPCTSINCCKVATRRGHMCSNIIKELMSVETIGLLLSTRSRPVTLQVSLTIFSACSEIENWDQQNCLPIFWTVRISIGNESVPIQLAQCWFPGLAISNAQI